MHGFLALASTLALALSAVAIQVTVPNNSSGWSSTGTNTLAWNRVDTDPTTFTVVLTNVDRSVLAVNNQLLVSSVDASKGSSIAIAAPSGGFNPGAHYRVNLVKSPDELDTILAQSDEFDITSGGSSGSVSGGVTVTAGTSSTTSGSLSSSTSTTTISGFSASQTGSTMTVSPGGTVIDGSATQALNPTTTSGAATTARHVGFGLLGVVAAAIVLF